MRLRKKKSLLDQASDYVVTVRPQVESAVAQAREAIGEFVEDTARPALTDARDKAAPALADARVKAATYAADAREKAGPALADAKAKAAPVVASGVALAAEKAVAAKTMADAKLAELMAEPEPEPKKGGKVKKIFLVGVLAGAVGFIVNRLRGDSGGDNWQSSYVPSPPPTATEDDHGGASPDEAIADSTGGAHAATTPDDPADVVPIDDRP
ncbi:hypothetical protein [Nocardioides pantholopis]|uniref:hypothetical protein n=1 Tax=Nocardioides pantholopis TaxID=2483798 RepID=UPI000F07F2B7|nr:hypothetical protein [Nocardioides pantholopis]